MKQAALVYQAYIALSLDDPLSSLSAATDLLAPEAPPSKARTRTWLELIEPQVA